MQVTNVASLFGLNVSEKERIDKIDTCEIVIKLLTAVICEWGK